MEHLGGKRTKDKSQDNARRKKKFKEEKTPGKVNDYRKKKI